MRLARGGLDEVEDDLDCEEDGDDSVTHGDGTLAKGPLANGCPLIGIQNTQKLGELPHSIEDLHMYPELIRFRDPQNTAT